MKTNIVKILIVLSMQLMASCKDDGLPNHETEITINVATEDGTPVADVEVRVTHDYANKSDESVQYAKTDKNGNAVTSARSRGSVIIRTTNPFYYPTYEDEIGVTAGPLDYEHTPLKHVKHNVVIRKIIKPIPLFAKQNDIPIPEKEKWIGFDLQVCDWVYPYGKGKESDVEFFLENKILDVPMSNGQSGVDRIAEIKDLHIKNPRLKANYLAHRDEFFNLPSGTSTYEQAFAFRVHPWQGKLKMRVPFEKGGLIAEKENYLFYSKSPTSAYARLPVTEMRMPHQAPTTDYQAEYAWEKIPGQTLVSAPPEFGFLIKTRVKLDEKGNEISAHYAKFITDVEIDIRGRIKFTSYFNPTPNDTNLEFDLKKNLFKDLKDEEKPFLP
jgi:hypothetical protein